MDGEERDDDRTYEAMRDRYWELAGVEGMSLRAFLQQELGRPAGADHIARLRRLVDDVLDTALQNIAVKAEEEGGIYEALAEERMAEVGEERAALAQHLDAFEAGASG